MQEEIFPWANFFPSCVREALAQALRTGALAAVSRAVRGAKSPMKWAQVARKGTR